MSDGLLHNQTMNILKNSLDAVSLRHKTISNNIANINTPNYKRQLVSFEEELASYLQKHQNIPLKRTHSLHVTQSKINSIEIKPLIEEEDKTALRTDGNNVDIDLELAMLAENTVKFNVLSQSINKKYSILRSVIQGGR